MTLALIWEPQTAPSLSSTEFPQKSSKTMKKTRTLPRQPFISTRRGLPVSVKPPKVASRTQVATFTSNSSAAWAPITFTSSRAADSNESRKISPREILKSLKGDVQQKTGEILESAVITVPAAFELHQCDATRKAAQLAGFKDSPLLQEPVAAALAYGFQTDGKKAYWLVYDFGGGTFDAAVIKAEEGSIHVVNHGGDNFLGGSDIDWAIIEELLIPRLLQDYDLEDFSRAHAGWDDKAGPPRNWFNPSPCSNAPPRLPKLNFPVSTKRPSKRSSSPTGTGRKSNSIANSLRQTSFVWPSR